MFGLMPYKNFGIAKSWRSFGTTKFFGRIELKMFIWIEIKIYP